MTRGQKLSTLGARAVLLKNELFELKLYRSAHLMDEVTRALGWEIAELREEEEHTRRRDAKGKKK